MLQLKLVLVVRSQFSGLSGVAARISDDLDEGQVAEAIAGIGTCVALAVDDILIGA